MMRNMLSMTPTQGRDFLDHAGSLPKAKMNAEMAKLARPASVFGKKSKPSTNGKKR